MAPLGVGIQGMKERMRQLSGRLEVTSRPNKGTIVTATLPIREQRPETVADSPPTGMSRTLTPIPTTVTL